MATTITFSVRMDRETLAALNLQAVREERNRSAMVRRAVRFYLTQRSQPSVRDAGEVEASPGEEAKHVTEP